MVVQRLLGGLLLGAGVGVGILLTRRLFPQIAPTPPELVIVNPPSRADLNARLLPSKAAQHIPFTAIQRSPALDIGFITQSAPAPPQELEVKRPEEFPFAEEVV